ncbi:tryptophan tryptophylquinone biosynthesis enzyme MauG [Methylophaga sp. OBS3]|uniref:tryptophan tryptophylquinone biosynthesis enzyme MauG n=1 Tax=Methylophaga sp. OBS3 TaxID=2991934 RepID=UPI0022581509|nr:tryptophan tryptophylquinone biosynthesis enzyme MauG [Methylophaga sp. OBS3]MCX4190505.1 tryptophan tryptophylquinone biosynthesis enzyme MauG [Methylophaga sp. OBS3]
MKIRSLVMLACTVFSVHVSLADDVTNRAEFQRPESIPTPSTNPLSVEKTTLGKTLFFDTRLSRDKGISCATCHSPAHRWSDGRKVPIGSENLEQPRRSPTVLNSAWLSALMWDGRANSLEAQAVLPITTPHEMNYSMQELVQRLAEIKGYQPLFKAAYGDTEITTERIAMALATFQRTLISNKSSFDRWVDGDEQAISPSAQRGFEIFNGKAQCAACHKSWRFTDDSFHDIGLDSPDLGRGKHVPAEVTIMQHAFKTPTLRDLPENGPFMHNGSMSNLEEVIKHYEDGGIKRASLSKEMKPFVLSEQQRANLIAFLKTLDGGPLAVKPPRLPKE